MPRLAPFGRLLPYLRPYRLRMAAAALLVMGAAGINLSMLWVIRRLVDTVLVQRDAAALNTAIAELGGLFLLPPSPARTILPGQPGQERL